MAAYNTIIQPEAEADLDEAFEYLEGVRSGLGFDLLSEVATLISLLEENPYLFPTIHGQKRRAIVKRFKYNLIYKIKGNDVFILAIIHGSKNPTWWQRRN